MTVTAVEDVRYFDRMSDRYAALRTVWRVSEERRLATCRRVPNGDGIEVRVKGTPGAVGARAGISGLQTCGSVWACPVCSEIINAGRQQEVEQALTNWIEGGGAVSFVTLTLQHSRRDPLDEMWDALADGWRKVIQSVTWRGNRRKGVVVPGTGIKDAHGIAGVLRLVEVKHGQHGWHPHLHLLLFHEREQTDVELEQLRSRLFGRWSQVLGQAGYKALEFDKSGQAVGVDVRPVKDAAYMSEYFAKNGYRPKATAVKGAAYEVTGSHSKKAGKGGRTPFEILAGIVAHETDVTVMPDGQTWVNRRTGELVDEQTVEASTTDLLLWREWEKTSKGRRQLTWSRGLRELVGLAVEEDTDYEIVDMHALNGQPVDWQDEMPITDIMSCQLDAWGPRWTPSPPSASAP